MKLSKEVKALSQLPWFPELMRELGYERIVRCGECKHYDRHTSNCEGAQGFARHWNMEDFCSDGERRTDAEKTDQQN